MSNIAQKIIQYRKDHNLTQNQLAQKWNVSFQTISKWENEQSYPDISLLPVIASTLGTSIDALLDYRPQKIQTSKYETLYDTEHNYWGQDIWSECYNLLKHRPPVSPLHLLDVGCGEGQAAIFFAKNGYTVSAFDIADSGIKKAQAIASQHHLDIDFFKANILDYRLEHNFDIILSSGTLQYIPPSYRKEIIDNYKKHTNINGIHLMNVFVDKPFIPLAADFENTEYLWHTGELFQYYHDWKIEKMDEIIFPCSSGGTKHSHCMNIMMATKI